MPRRAKPYPDSDLIRDPETEAALSRQLDTLTRMFLLIAQGENHRFLTEHAGIAVTAGAATGAYALIGAGLRIFAGMICHLPPERQDLYIANLIDHVEPALRAHIERRATGGKPIDGLRNGRLCRFRSRVSSKIGLPPTQ